MSAKTAKKARHADVEQAMVEQAQPVIVTDVAVQEDATPEQAMPLPTRRSSAARFMADLLKPIANRVAAQTPKAHLWELIKFLNAVDHGNGDAARVLADGMLELTLTLSAVVIAQRSTAIEAEAPVADGQPRRTSAARFTADLLKPVANRIGARTPKAIAWELIKFYNAVDHGHGERATDLAHSLYHQTITLVGQQANPGTDDHGPARVIETPSDDMELADELLPDF